MYLIRPCRPAPGARPRRRVARRPTTCSSTEEARARAAGKPWSFLHISKPEIDLPAGLIDTPAVYAKAAENLACHG